ncbi:MazG nucleotide pyrophosphohydrolase domain-containing protein [Paenibacillus marinisediminis]
MNNGLTLAQLQSYIKQTDYRPHEKTAYFLKLVEEVGELADVVRKDKRLSRSKTIKGTIEEEIADVLYYTLALANVYEINLEECFFLKDEINKQKGKK